MVLSYSSFPLILVRLQDESCFLYTVNKDKPQNIGETESLIKIKAVSQNVLKDLAHHKLEGKCHLESNPSLSLCLK